MHYGRMDTEWFKARKKELKISDTALGAALGVERSVANRVVNGGVAFNARRAAEVAKLFNASRDEILFRAGISDEQPRDQAFGQGKVTRATPGPVLGSGDIAMVGIRHADALFGAGATFTDFIEQHSTELEVLQFPKIWVDSITYVQPELLSWVRARGRSMEPTIGDGDLLLLDHSERRVEDQDDIWAFTVGDTRSIKRLRVKGDRFVILSDNPSVPDDEEMIDFVHIVARVIFIGKRT
jgi:hypothetical protein